MRGGMIVFIWTINDMFATLYAGCYKREKDFNSG